MQYSIVGALLILIIVCAGWLIGFYNIQTNKKFLLDEGRAHLDQYNQKRMNLISEAIAEINSDVELNKQYTELAELELTLLKQSEIYSDQVKIYNQFLNLFPNNIASKILGVKEASAFQFGQDSDNRSLPKNRHADESSLWAWQWGKFDERAGAHCGTESEKSKG